MRRDGGRFLGFFLSIRSLPCIFHKRFLPVHKPRYHSRYPKLMYLSIYEYYLSYHAHVVSPSLSLISLRSVPLFHLRRLCPTSPVTCLLTPFIILLSFSTQTAHRLAYPSSCITVTLQNRHLAKPSSCKTIVLQTTNL